MEDAQIAQILSSQSTATTGMTVAQNIDAALAQVTSPNDLKTLIDARIVQTALATAKSVAPTIAAPANAAAIAAFLLTASSTPNIQEAYLTLKRACAGFLATPQTNTWDDVLKALLILPTVILKGAPHLANL